MADDDRARIARELHDVIAHAVSVMTVQAGAVRRRLDAAQERERESLEAVEETGREALTELRRLGALLGRGDDGPELAPLPGVAAVHELVERLRGSGRAIELEVEGEPAHLPAGVDVCAYRIVEEALEEGKDGRTWVAVRYGDDGVEVLVESDGRETAGDLTGVRERTLVCGGELAIGPREGGGFRVSARLPTAT